RLDHHRRALGPQLTMIGKRQAAESRDAIRDVARCDGREALVIAAAVAGLAVGRAIDRVAGRQCVVAPQPFAPEGHKRHDPCTQRGHDAYARPPAFHLNEAERHTMSPGSIPRVANTRATASPILLFGVLAPAVRPTVTGPVPPSQSGVS